MEIIADLGLLPTREANHCKCGAEEKSVCPSRKKVKRKAVKAKAAAKRPQNK